MNGQTEWATFAEAALCAHCGTACANDVRCVGGRQATFSVGYGRWVVGVQAVTDYGYSEDCRLACVKPATRRSARWRAHSMTTVQTLIVCQNHSFSERQVTNLQTKTHKVK